MPESEWRCLLDNIVVVRISRRLGASAELQCGQLATSTFLFSDGDYSWNGTSRSTVSAIIVLMAFRTIAP